MCDFKLQLLDPGHAAYYTQPPTLHAALTAQVHKPGIATFAAQNMREMIHLHPCQQIIGERRILSEANTNAIHARS